MQKRTDVYLAGPDVFRKDFRERGAFLKARCEELGMSAHYPTDFEVDQSLGAEPIARAIFRANVEAIDRCHVVLANVSPFRGPSADIGTGWEMGYASASGKVVVAYTSDVDDYANRAVSFCCSARCKVLALGAQIENFGLKENLMLACSWNRLFVSENLDDAFVGAAKFAAQCLGVGQ